MNTLDVQRARAAFPALGGDAVFLDNAGGSQVLGSVADRVRDYLLTTSVQLGASYPRSQLASERVLAARRSVAELINAPHDDEVVIGAATTSLFYLFTQALAPSLRPGDEVIVTDTDHEANIGCWMKLRAAGVTLRVWEVNRETLRLDLADLERLLTPRTRWVAMTHASNVLGTVNPVAEVARLVHAAGARLCVDAVAYAPHRLVDVQASGADAYVFSFYKVYGPHQAVLWAPRELLLSLPGLNHYFIDPRDIPYKLQPGNVNFELSWGCGAIGDYFYDTGTALGATGGRRERMQAASAAFGRHEDTLCALLLGYLRGKPGVRIIGEPTLVLGQGGLANRMATVSFVVQGRRSEDLVRRVDGAGIGIRFGDFYARRLIEALGLGEHGGVVRVSAVHYNTAEEIGRLIAALEEAIG